MRPHSAALPRPEYPRPDRQRGKIEGVDWLNLNGPWQFRFSPLGGPPEPECVIPGSAPWNEQIIVPFCWESLAAWGEADAAGNDRYYSSRVFRDPSAVNSKNHRSAQRYEVGWYRRSVHIPTGQAWLSKRIILTVGAADFATDCWCNGVYQGRHEGGYVPFEFDLTETLNKDQGAERTAFIVFRVEDPMDNRHQPVGKQWSWYTTISGIWQTVLIEPRSFVHLGAFRLIPDIDTARIEISVKCADATADHYITIEILAPQAQGPQIRLPWSSQDGNLASGSLVIEPLLLWDPDHPHLYPVILRLFNLEGAIIDEVRSYFGMRKIGTAPAENINGPNALSLNNRPIYLRGALYQSYHPDGIYTAGDVSTIRNDIAFARKAGFDFLRIHIKLDDPLVLFYADTLGILIMQDFPNFGEGGDTPLGRRRFLEMMEGGMERDFNHPSIIAWCIFNESWGFGGQRELIKLIVPQNAGESQAEAMAEKFANTDSFSWIHETWLLAKKLDPTRLIEDMSVVAWEHLVAYGHVDTDINSWHFYIDDYWRAKAHIAEVVSRTHRGSAFNYIDGFSQGDAPLINSEYGGVGALDGDRDIGWSFKFLTNELRLHRELSAYIFTELTDVEWERNGFLNYDRTAKNFGYDPVSVNHADVLPIDAPPIVQIAPREKVSIRVFSSHYSRLKREGVTFTWRYSGIDSLGVRHPQLASGHGPLAFPHHGVAPAGTLELTMPDEMMLCTLDVAAVDRDGCVVAQNQIQHFVCNEEPLVHSSKGLAVIHRPRLHQWSSARWSAGIASQEESERDGTCWGGGSGYFEWTTVDPELRLLDAGTSIRVLLEISSRKEGTAQTDHERIPSRCEVLINGVRIHLSDLPNHPYDSRGALSYLHGGRGAYGYLINVSVAGSALQKIVASARGEGELRLRCAVNSSVPGGLTVYGYNTGRYPCGPTIMLNWNG